MNIIINNTRYQLKELDRTEDKWYIPTNNYKINQKLKVRKDLYEIEAYVRYRDIKSSGVTPEMAKLEEKIVTIRDIDCTFITISGSPYKWNPWMFETLNSNMDIE